MATWLIILITFVIAFFVGSLYGKQHPRQRGKFLLKLLVAVLAVVFSILALAGLLAFISPTLAIALGSKLPEDVQLILLTDILLRGGTGLWVFLILSGVLWWVWTRIRV
jgi:hypothetical protein